MIYKPQTAWVKGPTRAGRSDNVVYSEREDGEDEEPTLKEQMESTPGKMAVADAGFGLKAGGHFGLLCLPNSKDSKELARFKTRARCRHETFNGRINNFAILQHTFRHGWKCHKFALEAVVVIVQYQMDNGAPIFDV